MYDILHMPLMWPCLHDLILFESLDALKDWIISLYCALRRLNEQWKESRGDRERKVKVSGMERKITVKSTIVPGRTTVITK